MKLFKTTALIAALATSFSASAALKTLDDAALTEVTGQEGITIVMSAKIKNLDVAYTDSEYKLDSSTPAKITDIDTDKGGTLGIDGIRTDALTLTQKVDIVSTSETADAIKSTDLASSNDRVLAISIDGIKGTFTVGALRVGKDVKTAIGGEEVAFETKLVKEAVPEVPAANGKPAVPAKPAEYKTTFNTEFHKDKATSLGSLTLGNLVTDGGITQYIFAH